jgi:hypothetical protein
MKPDASLIQYLTQLSSKSAMMTSYVRRVIMVQDLYEQGVTNFSSEVVGYDMTILSGTLAYFISQYKNAFLPDRSTAI